MQLHERLIQETEGLPEPMLVEVLDFLRGLKGRSLQDDLPVIVGVGVASASVEASRNGNRQVLLDRVEYLETVLGIQKGLASFDRGEGIPADEALESLRQKFNIPSRS